MFGSECFTFFVHLIFSNLKRSLFFPRRSFLMHRRRAYLVISFWFLEQQKKYPFKKNPSSGHLWGLITSREMLACWNWSSSPPHKVPFPQQQVAKCSAANSLLWWGGQLNRFHQRGKMNWTCYKGGGKKQITEIGACLLVVAAVLLVHSIKYLDPPPPWIYFLKQKVSIMCIRDSRGYLLEWNGALAWWATTFTCIYIFLRFTCMSLC